MGSLMTFLVTSAETENRFFLLELRMKPEMSRRISTMTRMRCITLEGELEVYCMGKSGRCGRAKRSSSRNQAHAFYYLSPTLRFLALLQPGGLDGYGLDGYFEAMSSPATSMELPEATALSDPARHRAGCQVRSQDADPETAELLPHYPGWGTAKEPGHLPGRDRRQEETSPIYSFSSLSSHHLPSGSCKPETWLGNWGCVAKNLRSTTCRVEIYMLQPYCWV